MVNGLIGRKRSEACAPMPAALPVISTLVSRSGSATSMSREMPSVELCKRIPPESEITGRGRTATFAPSSNTCREEDLIS